MKNEQEVAHELSRWMSGGVNYFMGNSTEVMDSWEKAITKALLEARNNALEEAIKAINIQHLDEKFWTLPSHPKSESRAIDEIIGAVIRDRVQAIRQLIKTEGT